MSEDRLNSLLSVWQQQQAQGRDVPPTELCRDCPELADELKQRIQALCQMNALLHPGGAPSGASQAPTNATAASVAPKRAGDSLVTDYATRVQQDADAEHARVFSKEAPALVPNVLGYEIQRELGRGGMGVVYQARHLKLNRLVALKMIRGGASAGPEELQRFRTEAEATARLQHGNIVQIFEVGEYDSLPFFALEYCAGGALDKKLAGTPLPAQAAATLVEKLARSMHAAHAKGIIHRDLKPGNVLLAEDGTPKISDFGLAKTLDGVGQTATGKVMGTPSYMAPEQARGQGNQLGPACDTYALGAILYECLTGRPPFKAATSHDTIMQVLHQEPVPPTQLQPRVPRDLETICLACLRKEPGKRYATALDLAEDLRRFQQGEPIQARPVGKMERTVKWVRRRPTAATLAACLLVLVVGAAAVGTWYWLDWADRQTRQERVSSGK